MSVEFTHRVSSRTLENELDINRIPYWRPIRPRTRPKLQRHEDIAKLPVVATILRWIEPEKLRIPPLVDVEIGGEVITPNRCGRGQRRQEELRRCWGIGRTGTSACAGTDAASGSGSNAGPRSAP